MHKTGERHTQHLAAFKKSYQQRGTKMCYSFTPVSFERGGERAESRVKTAPVKREAFPINEKPQPQPHIMHDPDAGFFFMDERYFSLSRFCFAPTPSIDPSTKQGFPSVHLTVGSLKTDLRFKVFPFLNFPLLN